ncbi:Glycoside hydrolase family 18 protein [Pleurostoma richardsiae]|uniref:chitinase n=1 Tax=Pleurostoma richardsiae TaxID=41990 RepID=A0AA38W0M1_9PEZI|nr:Glycoside hydrolase family 18 protein [Pleurostoma richardsiae]
MLAPVLFVVAPLLLAVPAQGAPQHHNHHQHHHTTSGGSCVEAITETVTYTTTIYADDPSDPTSLSDDPLATQVPTAIYEHYSPAATQSLTIGNLSLASSTPSYTPFRAVDTLNSTDAPSVYQNSLYFTNWGIYGANYQPQDIPASSVTRILYAFANIESDGSVVSSDTYADLEKHYSTDSWNDAGTNAYGCVKQLYLLKKQNRQMKVLLSIGGWSYSSKFPAVAASATARQKFASTAVQLVGDWGFDGIDIDWEYPASATEAANFVLLLQACRQALDDYAAEYAPGYHFLITVASPAGPTNYNMMDLEGMDAWVDSWNLMAYDYAGSWDTTTGHQANIYSNAANPLSTKFSTEQAVRDYIVAGVAASKIHMGLPLYGRSFESTTGLGKAYSGVGAGDAQAGVWLYKSLPRSGATEYYDDAAKASYSYDSSSLELISYDNVASAVEKSSYLVRRGLGGAVFWEASGDKTGAESLVGTLAEQMGALDASQNLLSYPASQYDNIKNGMPDS